MESLNNTISTESRNQINNINPNNNYFSIQE